MASVVPAASSSVKGSKTTAKTNKNGGVLGKFPLPDAFYAIKAEVAPITSKAIAIPVSVLLYLITAGAFAALWWFYSSPSNYQTTTVLQSDYVMEGFECKPMQEYALHGYRNMWTYDECKEKVNDIDVSLVERTTDGTTHWDYKFFNNYSISYHANGLRPR